MELFLATADLKQRRRLTFDDVDESHPMLSRDDLHVVFTEGAPDSHRTRVVLTGVNGEGRMVLTDGNVFGAIPTFSWSDLHIAYCEWTFDDTRKTFSLPRVVVLDTVSSRKSYLTEAGREAWRPVFSADDKSVFYIAKVGGQFDIFEHNLETGTERRLTNTLFDEWDPQVSSDGSRLVYAAHADGNWDLFVQRLDSGDVHRLTQSLGDEWDPSFSPDASSVLFAGRFGLLEAMFEMPLSE